MIEFKKLATGIVYTVFSYDTNKLTSVAKNYKSGKSWYNNPGYIMSDDFDEINKVRQDLINFKGIKQLGKSEKLFIHDHSFIPSILISQLKQDNKIEHKRCIDINKATSIVCDLDFSPLYFYYYAQQDLNNENIITVCDFDSTNALYIHYSVADKCSVQENYQSFKKLRPNVKYVLFLTNIDVVQLIYDHPDKIIDSKYFAFQIQDSLPEIEDEEWNTLKSMITSLDKQNQILAYKIMQARDIRKRYFDIAKAIKSVPCMYLPTFSALPTAMEYIVMQLGIHYDRLRLNGDLTVMDMMAIYNDTINKQETKDHSLVEIYKYTACLLSQINPDFLQFLNCTIELIPDQKLPLLSNPSPTENRLAKALQLNISSSCKSIIQFLQEHNMQYILVRHDS